MNFFDVILGCTIPFFKELCMQFVSAIIYCSKE
jgi:hypothetical protein